MGVYVVTRTTTVDADDPDAAIDQVDSLPPDTVDVTELSAHEQARYRRWVSSWDAGPFETDDQLAAVDDAAAVTEAALRHPAGRPEREPGECEGCGRETLSAHGLCRQCARWARRAMP